MNFYALRTCTESHAIAADIRHRTFRNLPIVGKTRGHGSVQGEQFEPCSLACGVLAVVLADEANDFVPGGMRPSSLLVRFTMGYGFSRSPASVSTSQTFLISCRISAFMTAPAISGSIGCAESLFAGNGIMRSTALMCCKLRIITACKTVWLKVYDGGFGLSRRACVNLRFKTQQVRRRTRLFMQAQKLRAKLSAGDSEPGEARPSKPYLMSRKVYQRHIRQLLKLEGAIFSSQRIASPRYRRFRYRNGDGSFVTSTITAAPIRAAGLDQRPTSA